MVAVKKMTSTTTGRARSLLVELGTEELPPRALKQLGESFASSVYDFLLQAGVVRTGKDNYQFYASPRRLAVWIGQVTPRQPDQVIQRKGPSTKAGFGCQYVNLRPHIII